MAALALVLESDHAYFLHHDSYVACNGLLGEYTESEVHAAADKDPDCYKGFLSADAFLAVEAALIGNRLLPRKYLEDLATAWARSEE